MAFQRKISLLYAEDDPQASEMLQKLLRHKFPDLTLHVASDGEQGVALYKEHRPDFVLADITMPILDGIEMTKQIRMLAPEAYVIALTAYNDAEWQRRSAEVRFDVTLTKPVEFRKLLDAVGEAIKIVRQKEEG